MVMKAFTFLSEIPTKLFIFSDDMDGLRKVPDNVPNKELIEKNLENLSPQYLIHLKNFHLFQNTIITN